MDFSQDAVSPVRRYGGMSIVVLAHAAVVYALIANLAHKLVDAAVAPLDIKMIKEIKPQPPDPDQPPPPKMTAPPPYVPPPEVQIEQSAQPNAITVLTKYPPATALDQTIETPQVTAAVTQPPATRAIVDLESCAPVYSPISLRFEEEGTVRIKFDIGPDDMLKEVKIVKSSGHPRLDRATVNALSRCEFKAGRRDGRPVLSTITTDYVWKISGYDY